MTNKELLIYQGKNGEIILKEDGKNETIWANQKQIAEIFSVDSDTIWYHLKNIFADWELEKHATTEESSVVQKEGSREVKRKILFYNLDAIISVGYRVNSKQATQFRIWATKTLKEHITQWFTINKNRVQNNYDTFLEAVENVRKLLPATWKNIKTDDILELVKLFADTWLNLDSYDKDMLPKEWFTKSELSVSARELYSDVASFKASLIQKSQATEIFAQEKNKGALEGIFWNIFQSFDGNDVYPTIEEKAAHFLYFVVKNHPFVDGNKRTGAFCFLWFLTKASFHFSSSITPEALTAITLLVAESKPKDKKRIVGLIMLLLKK